MIDVAVTETEVATAVPNNLQIISPEEVHATMLGCVRFRNVSGIHRPINRTPPCFNGKYMEIPSLNLKVT